MLEGQRSSEWMVSVSQLGQARRIRNSPAPALIQSPIYYFHTKHKVQACPSFPLVCTMFVSADTPARLDEHGAPRKVPQMPLHLPLCPNCSAQLDKDDRFMPLTHVEGQLRCLGGMVLVSNGNIVLVGTHPKEKQCKSHQMHSEQLTCSTPPPYGNPVFPLQPRTVARTLGSQNHSTEIGNIRHPFVSFSCPPLCS